MKKLVALSVLVIVAVPAGAEWKGLVGRPAPALEIESWITAPEGKTLEDLRGRAVLLLFGDAAESGIPRWNDLRAAYWEKGLRIVAVPSEPPLGLDDRGIEFCIVVADHSGYGDGEEAHAVLVGPDGKVGWEGKPTAL